jgi:AcrR family transcriptional regulator
MVLGRDRSAAAKQSHNPGGQTADMRDRIVAGAQVLFVRDGLIATTIAAIVAEARTSKREFYKYFTNRDDVFLEVVQKLLGTGGSIDVLPERELKEGLYYAARSSYVSHLSQQNLGLFRASIAASAQSPDLARTVYESRAQTSTALAAYLENHRQREGLVFDDAFLTALRFGFLAVNGLRFTMGGRALDEREQEAHSRDVCKLFLSGRSTAAIRKNPDAVGKKLPGQQIVPGARREAADEESATRLGPELWNKLHAAAWAEFSQRGYTASSIEKIARACKVARTTIYRRFPSKQAFFLASVKRVIEQIHGPGIAIDWGKLGVRGGLIALSDTLLERFLTHDNLMLHKMLLFQAASTPDMTYELYSYATDMVQQQLAPFLAQLAAIGAIEPDADGCAAWQFFVLSTVGARLIFIQPSSANERRKLVAEAVDLFLYGCKRPARR